MTESPQTTDIPVPQDHRLSPVANFDFGQPFKPVTAGCCRVSSEGGWA
jgi:hypothetical protein